MHRGRVCSPSEVLAECLQREALHHDVSAITGSSPPGRLKITAERAELQNLILARLQVLERTEGCMHHVAASTGGTDPATIEEGCKVVHPVSAGVQPVRLWTVPSPLCFWALC